VSWSRGRYPGKALKRVRQAAYLVLHSRDHARCALAVRRSGLRLGRRASTKYLGDCFALSLTTAQRRRVLFQHQLIMAELFSPAAIEKISRGVTIWTREVPDGPPLSLVLEPAMFAPMEGELQLRFSFGSDLHVLTFVLADGALFDSDRDRVLFIGGVQGRRGCREEIRAASKLNGEIAPAAMLLLAAQASAEELGAELLAVGEADQISMSYSLSMIRFDYGTFWTKMGGSIGARFYSLPLHSPQRPLASVGLSHRARTRNKRDEKSHIRESIAAAVRDLRHSTLGGLGPEPVRS
jgi:uncharacterized protein VirK/YbjX